MGMNILVTCLLMGQAEVSQYLIGIYPHLILVFFSSGISYQNKVTDKENAKN